MRTILTDDQLAAIAWAAPSETTADLARRLGAHYGPVYTARRRMRLLREAAGPSQQDLAARSGLTHEEISRLELGHRVPFIGTVRTLAQTLRVEPEHFVRGAAIGLSELSVGEVARRLGIPATRTQRWVRDGVLPARKVSGQWRVPAVAVRELGGSGRLRGSRSGSIRDIGDEPRPPAIGTEAAEDDHATRWGRR